MDAINLFYNIFSHSFSPSSSFSKTTQIGSGMRSQVSVKVDADKEFVVSLTSPAMSILLDTYRNFRTPNRAAQYLLEPSEVGTDELPPVTIEDVDILLWNKLGQDATLQLYFHDFGEVSDNLFFK